MQITKIEAGEYKVEKDNIKYLISKNSYIGDWSIYFNQKCLVSKKTKKECLDIIESGYAIKILDKVSVIPSIKIGTYFINKNDKNIVWVVKDIIYSSNKGKWAVEGSYYKDPINSKCYSWDEDEFEEECEIISDGCGSDGSNFVSLPNQEMEVDLSKVEV